MDASSFSITEARKLLQKKQMSSFELISACLRQIKENNKEYNVLLTVEDEMSLAAQAKAADKTEFERPLEGIPVVLKDLFSSKDMRTSAASKVLDRYVPVFDATVVKKLRDGGAIIIGKANQDAWAHGSSGENSDFGPTRNAFDKNHVAGGSSSGSATAVALGMSLFATGTDTGGSIRVPASYHNLVGLKPTYGRVSRYGIIAMASSLDSIGHITRTVKDSAYVLSITAGADPYDGTSGEAPVPKYHERLKRKDLKGVRIGVSPEYLAVGKQATQGMNPKLEEVIEASLTALKRLGAEVVEVALPTTKAALETYYIICPSEISSNLARYDGIRYGNGREAFGPEAKRRIMIGTYALSSGYYDAYYKTAQKVRTLVVNDFQKAFQTADVIFAPVTPTPPPKIGEYVNDPLANYLSDIYTVPINLAGLAALSLPAGFVGKLPVGFQLIGPQWSEQLLFDVGNVYEQATKVNV